MKQRFDQVLVICPDTTTGGPEALHQLVDSINRQGGRAQLVYTGQHSKFEIKDGTVTCSHSLESPAYRTYKRYSPRVVSSASLTANSLLVFPEIDVDMAWAAYCCLPCSVACWWLAVHDLSSTHDEAWCRDFVDNVIQMCQSYYAIEYLRGKGGATIVPVFDYTDLNFVRRGLIQCEQASPHERRPGTVAFFPRKGKDLATKFFDNLKGFSIVPVPIENMSKEQVLETLSSTELYIDFGHQPGKDRVPREAAALGNVVLLHKMGSALHYLDHNLDDIYKFHRDDIESGALKMLAQGILEDTSIHLDRQRHYRQRILLEREEFDLQVRQFFFHVL